MVLLLEEGGGEGKGFAAQGLAELDGRFGRQADLYMYINGRWMDGWVSRRVDG